MLSTIVTVYKHLGYTAAAILIAVAVFLLAVWLPNISLITTVLSSSNATFLQKASLIFSLLGSIKTNFTVISAISTVAISVLFGMNMTLLIYYIRMAKGSGSEVSSLGGVGLGGLLSGFLGIGCAACGTFILSSVLVLVGATGILAYLPLGGEEFGFLGILLLGYVAVALTRKISSPAICSI